MTALAIAPTVAIAAQAPSPASPPRDEPSTVWLPACGATIPIPEGAAVLSYRASRASTLSVVVVAPDRDRFADRVARAHATLHGRSGGSRTAARAMLHSQLRPIATWHPTGRVVRPADDAAREALRAWLQIAVDDSPDDWDLRLQLRASRATPTRAGTVTALPLGSSRSRRP